METKRTFTKQQLREEYDLPGFVGESCNGCTVLSNKIIDQRRWSTVHELIFRLDDMEPDTAWRVSYSVGSTEQQDEGPWEYDKEITAQLFRHVEKVVKVWEPVK